MSVSYSYVPTPYLYNFYDYIDCDNYIFRENSRKVDEHFLLFFCENFTETKESLFVIFCENMVHNKIKTGYFRGRRKLQFPTNISL